MIELRQATPDDALTVAQLHIAGWRDGYADLLPSSFLESLDIHQRAENWKKHLGDGSIVWIATYNTAPAGVVSFGPPLNPIPHPNPHGLTACGEITMIYTLGQFYRLGVGTALFRHACDCLKREGYTRIYLWVLEDNKKGRAFYDRMGGHVVDNALQIATIGNAEFREIAYEWCLE